MSVKIEILDYKYGDSPSIVDVDAGSPQTGWTSLSVKSAKFEGDGTNNVKYYENISSSIIAGKTYKISFEITNYSGTGNIGFSQSDSSSTALGISNSAKTSSNGTVNETFTAVAAGQIRVFSRGTVTNAVMQNISVIDTDGIDWENSVVGELDVTDHSDFPLAMTFQISEIKDLTSTSGDYSKTFKIPATKNNNKLLKNTYIPNVDTDVNITENKKCRILINNLFSVKGLIKVIGVGGYGEVPSYYSCVFFGSNLSWADELSNQYMNELDWGVNGEGLQYNKTSIMATWQDENCDSSTSPIVYPITSYGDYNPDGEPKTIQLLDTAYDYSGTGSTTKVGYYGFWNSGASYGTPLPSADWRPAVFVKDTLEKIFNQVGYNISSSFIGTNMFKKLVWLLPNFKYNNSEERYNEYSVKSNFTNTIVLDTTVYDGGVSYVDTDDGVTESFYGGSVTFNDGDDNYIGDPTASGIEGTKQMPLSADRLNVTLDEGSYVDTTNDYITIGEYGYYNIKLNGIQSRAAIIWSNTAASNGVEEAEICINVDVNTVGQTSYTTIDRTSIIVNPTRISSSSNLSNASNSLKTDFQSLPSVNIDNQWLNKGDKIRLTVGFRFNDMVSGSGINNQDFTVNIFSRVASSTEFNITLNSEAVEYGQTYDLSEVINKDYKSIDFVKGIAHAFNLKMTTDETNKTVSIEPFNTFYKDYADAIDWTYKLDRSKQIEDKWIKSDLKRDVLFKYKSDSKDKKVEMRGEEWFDGIKDEYPYQETLPKTFEKGESKYENPFFAGTHNTQDQDSSLGDYSILAYSSCLWEENTYGYLNNRPDKGFEFLPRLLYWNKYSPTGMPSPATYFGLQKFATVQTWASEIKYLNPNADAGTFGNIISNIYPQATSINRDDTSSPILSYGNVNVRDYNDATLVYSSYSAGKGLFETYYRNMFEMIKSKPRLRTVYIDLKTTDIVNLDFRKLVYIDGVYWRINKVVDYQPNKNQSTKVELVEWLQLGAFAETAPSFGGNDDTGGILGSSVAPPNNNNLGL